MKGGIVFWVSGVFALIAVAVVVVLARVIARGGGPRTSLWLALLALSVVLGSFLASIAAVYHRMPVGWIAILVLAAAVLVALFVRVGRDLSWHVGRLFGVAGLLVATLVLATLAMMFLPMGGLLIPVFETAAAQIADENGFTLLLPPGEEFITDYNPIREIDGEGVSLEYKGFTIQERNAEGALDEDALRSVLDEGTSPIGDGGPPIPGSATYEVFEVGNDPALGVEYDDSMAAEKQSLGVETVRVLALERDGVEVRIYSHGWMEYEGGTGAQERYTPVDAMPFEEMLAIARSLEPLK